MSRPITEEYIQAVTDALNEGVEEADRPTMASIYRRILEDHEAPADSHKLRLPIARRLYGIPGWDAPWGTGVMDDVLRRKKAMETVMSVVRAPDFPSVDHEANYLAWLALCVMSAMVSRQCHGVETHPEAFDVTHRRLAADGDMAPRDQIRWHAGALLDGTPGTEWLDLREHYTAAAVMLFDIDTPMNTFMRHHVKVALMVFRRLHGVRGYRERSFYDRVTNYLTEKGAFRPEVYDRGSPVGVMPRFLDELVQGFTMRETAGWR